MSNLTDRCNLLSRVIKQRAESLDKLKDEFNEHTRKANSAEYRWQKLVQEDMRDRDRLKELEQELNNIPTLSRQIEIA